MSKITATGGTPVAGHVSAGNGGGFGGGGIGHSMPLSYLNSTCLNTSNYAADISMGISGSTLNTQGSLMGTFSSIGNYGTPCMSYISPMLKDADFGIKPFK